MQSSLLASVLLLLLSLQASSIESDELLAIPSMKTAEIRRKLEENSAVEGESEEMCRLNTVYCKNQGVCVTIGMRPYCNCPSTHFGQHCEFLSDARNCDQHLCQHDAICYSTDSNRSVLAPATADHNDAILVTINYQCWCTDGRIGELCEFSREQRMCEEDHCLHRGIAVLTPDADLGLNCTCHCQLFYSGDRCQFVSPCLNFVCLNGATCDLTDDGEPLCVCPGGEQLAALGVEFDVHCAVSVTAHLGRSKLECLPCQLTATPLTYRHCLEQIQPALNSTLIATMARDSSTFCDNGGECILAADNFTSVTGQTLFYPVARCNCTDELTYGSYCEERRADLCELAPDEQLATGEETRRCRNNADCVIDPTNGGMWTCICKQGYTGQLCEIRDPCDPNPCKNGAQCLSIPDRVIDKIELLHTCLCNMSQGLQADTFDCVNPRYGPCVALPCANGSACFPCDLFGDQDLICDADEKRQGFHCVCKPGLAGKRCDSVFDACSALPCLNGGRCRILPHTLFDYRCECPSGFDGDICENLHDICLVQGLRTCIHGSCMQDDNFARGFRCDCHEGYQGYDCGVEGDDASFGGFLYRYGNYIYWAIELIVIGPPFVYILYRRERQARVRQRLFAYFTKNGSGRSLKTGRRSSAEISWDELPKEIWEEIVGYLQPDDFKTATRLQQTCSRLYNAVTCVFWPKTDIEISLSRCLKNSDEDWPPCRVSDLFSPCNSFYMSINHRLASPSQLTALADYGVRSCFFAMSGYYRELPPGAVPLTPAELCTIGNVLPPVRAFRCIAFSGDFVRGLWDVVVTNIIRRHKTTLKSVLVDGFTRHFMEYLLTAEALNGIERLDNCAFNFRVQNLHRCRHKNRRASIL